MQSVKRKVQSCGRGFTKNKKLIKTVIIIGLYYVSTYVSTPFFGVYQVNELGLNLKTIAVLALLESISRIIVSRKWGRYADSHSFSVMIKKCSCGILSLYRLRFSENGRNRIHPLLHFARNSDGRSKQCRNQPDL